MSTDLSSGPGTSSLDLDRGSWGKTEDSDAKAEELEESSAERESSELLVEDV